jgi:hypothetical protein
MLAFALMVASCASVTVQDAAPNDGRGDNLKDGYLYYPRRPYLHVKKEFPLEGGEGYIQAKRTKDGILFRSPWDERLQALPLGAILTRNKTGDLTSGEKKDDEGGATASTENSSEDRQTLSKATATAGYNPAVKEIEPLGDLFDIVYLPDVDNPRVLNASAPLGTADVSLAYGPGNTFNTFQTTADNREIGYVVKDLVDTTIKVAKKVAEMQTGLATLTSGQMDTLASDYKIGDTMLLKYRYVAYATPNLTPLVKEREFADARARSIFHEEDPYLRRPEYPYTRFAFKIRTEFSLIKEDLGAPGQNPKPEGADVEAEKSRQIAINLIFDKKTLELKDAGGKVEYKLTFLPTDPKTITADSEVRVTWLHDPSLQNPKNLLPRVLQQTIALLEGTPDDQQEPILNWLKAAKKPENVINLLPNAGTKGS